MKPITGKASFSVLLGAAFLNGHVIYWAWLYVANGSVLQMS